MMFFTFSQARTRPEALAASVLDRLKLRAGEVWSSRGLTTPAYIRVEQGRVWVTEEGDGRDHVLRAGECLKVRGSGVVVIEAVEDSLVFAPPRGGGGRAS